ncbi:winged helix-turn-helix transcriptional regulator [Streptomyces mirabilis]|uniref:winged helix-turn-helix transcriptional regulator n=1 Tax=Streptomyces mirabilis TaxID=68239 RepID=UPI0033C3CD0B
MVLAALAQGPAGFGEVRERVPGISDRMLADRLHELAVAGLPDRPTVQPFTTDHRCAPRNTCRRTPTDPATDPGGAAVRTVSRRGRLSPG